MKLLKASFDFAEVSATPTSLSLPDNTQPPKKAKRLRTEPLKRLITCFIAQLLQK